MRIVKYTTLLDNDKKTILVKESAHNYPNINKLNSPKKIFDAMNDIYNVSRLTEEYVWIIAFNNKCVPIGLFELSHGTVNMSLISPREIFVRLCLCGATMFTLVHNHPSGDYTPSNEDVQTTRKIYDCGQLMGIDLVDHIIIGDNYYSFNEGEIIC